MKKIIIIITCCIIAFSPLFNIGEFSFADTQPTWIYVTQQNSEPERTVVIGAIKAYLDGRGYNNIFTYNVEKAIVKWSYNNWDKFARQKGYNGLSDLNNHIAYRYNSNGKLQFFLDDSALQLMNEIYTAILEYYQIGANESKQIYSGQYFTDDDGNGCYVYYYDSPITGSINVDIRNEEISHLTKRGSNLKYSTADLLALVPNVNDSNTVSFNINNVTYNNTTHYFCQLNHVEANNYQNIGSFSALSNSNRYWSFYLINSSYDTNNEYTVLKDSNNNYFVGNIWFNLYWAKASDNHFTFRGSIIDNADINNAAINAAQAGLNAGIVAAGKAAAITTGKEGMNALKDYIEDNDSTDDDVIVPVDDPTTPPEDKPIEPGTPNSPYSGLPTGVSQDPNGGFNFSMPNLNLNWELDLDYDNLPFPFSIPLDFYHAFNALDVESEAPDFSRDIDINFGNKHYTWEFECNFEEIEGVDSLANIHRKLFLFVYVFALIIATRSVMHIY